MPEEGWQGGGGTPEPCATHLQVTGLSSSGDARGQVNQGGYLGPAVFSAFSWLLLHGLLVTVTK